MKDFIYKFDEGPLSSKEELVGGWKTGNCRRAVQYYIFIKKNIFLNPEDVLCPKAYNETGVFVAGKDNAFSFDQLTDGDIIYAEKIRNKKEENIDKSLKTFSSNDDYIISLHTGIFTGEKGKEIWHTTVIEGSSCSWSLEKFLHFYRPVVAKRINS
jgi:hypothetical protein